MTWIRKIQLQDEEYAFQFSNPKGALTKCTVTEGAGTVTLYEIKTTTDEDEKSQVGEPHILSLEPGHTFYVALNTATINSNWEIAIRGTGKFELELPDRLLSPSRRGYRSGLHQQGYDKVGRKKNTFSV